MEETLIKCNPNGCDVKKKCYRYCKKPSINTQYMNFEYTCNENSGFEMFIPIPKRIPKRRD